MAKKKKEACPPLALWLVTFSDLVTLLLTFFIMLLAMSSMDNSLLTTVTLTTGDLGLLSSRGAGRATVEVRQVVELMEKPWEVVEKQNRIKDLLFPNEELPPEMSRQDLDENLRVLERQDGVGLVFTDRILFEPGSSELSDDGRDLIAQLVPMLQYVGAPINVQGYADAADAELLLAEGEAEATVIGPAADDAFALSGDRALSVLAFLADQGIGRNRLSLSAYGETRPFGPDEDPAFARRVEILVRTARPLGGYL